MRRSGRKNATDWQSARLAKGALTAFVAVALAGTAFAVPAGAALVTRPVWQIQVSPNATAPGGQLASVSCSAPDACTAVGTAGNARGMPVTLAQRWNGTSWQRQSTPQPGRTIPDSRPGLSGVSCPTSAFCEAVGTNEVVGAGIGLTYGWNGSAWKRQSFPEPLGSTSVSLEQVSCVSARFCEAVGFYQFGTSGILALAAQWNGASWRLQHVPSPPPGGTRVLMTGVSCVSTTFCEALGNSDSTGAFAARWNGTSWHTQNLPGEVFAGSVSCASAAFCEVVGGNSADVWNGSSWSAQTIPGSGSASLAGVSCVSAAFCEAVGSQTSSSGNTVSLGLIWNGTSWALQPTPNPAAASVTSLSQVSCTAATACETAGSFQLTSSSGQLTLAESWNGTSWQIQHAVSRPGSVTNNLNGVSCVSAVFCEAVGSHLDSRAASVALAETWNGSTWRLQKAPDPAQAVNSVRMVLTGVSCVSAVFCEAVGSSSAAAGGGAEVWNGATWALQAVPGGSLTSVSCTSASFCMAAGADGHVDIWNGTSWAAQPTAAGFTSLSGVSCTSPAFCEAAGSGPSGDGAEVWNGTSWSPQAVPAPSNGNSPVLSAVSCTTATSCEAVGNYSSTTPLQAPLAEVWNGTAWAVQSVPVPAAAFISSLAGVWCTSANSCTAVGQNQPGTGPTATVAEVWNGTAWRLQATPNHLYAGQNSLSGVSCGASGICTAVGITTNPGQTPATLVETGD
jgi:hypothetical protein